MRNRAGVSGKILFAPRIEKIEKNGPKTVFFEVFLMSLFLRAVANSGKLKVISMILDGCGQKWKWPFSS